MRPSLGDPGHLATGTWFLVLAIVAGLVGGALSLSLHVPALMQGPNAAAWQAVASRHGPIVVAYAAVPALLGGFGTWFVPLQIGAANTAFPRLAAGSLLLLGAGFVLTVWGLLPGRPPALLLAAVALSGVAIVLCAANLVATILNLRRPGLSLGAMPVFAWSQLIAGGLVVATVPLLLAALTRAMLHPGLTGLSRGLDRTGSTILILPCLGLVSEIVAGLSGRPLAGRRLAIVAMAAFAMLSGFDWAHRLLNGVAGVDRFGRGAVALTCLVLLGCWGATLRRAPRARALLTRTPGLFALGVMAVLSIGSLVGLRDASQHDGAALGTVFALFAGLYWWIGRMTGRAYPEGLGRLQFWLLLAGVGLVFLPQPIPSALGAALACLSMLVFVLAMAVTLGRGRSVPAGAWSVDLPAPDWSLPPARSGHGR